MPVVVEKPNNLSEVSFEQREKELKEQENKEQEQISRMRRSPFASFYQINKNNSEFLRSCLKENPKALEMLFFIFDHMDKYNAVICSYRVFEEVLGISCRTVARSIQYLKNNGFIYIYKSGASNVYVANKDLVWNSWGNNIDYCEFPANIVLSKAEQEEQEEQIKEINDKRLTMVQLKEKNNDKGVD